MPLTDDELRRTYEAARSPWVRAVMVATPSGHTCGPSGSSRDISGPPDQNVMTFLRSISDVVMVGATTAVNDGYGPIRVRESRRSEKSPRLCIVSGSGHFTVTDDIASAHPIVVTHHPHDQLFEFADVVVAADLSTALTSLFGMGLTRIDCEGGAKLLASMLEAHLVDEVDLTRSPINSQHGPLLPDLSAFTVTHTLRDDQWQFDRMLRR